MAGDGRQTPSDGKLASRNGWAERAMAYDSYAKVQQGGGTPDEMLQQVARNLLMLVRDASNKLVQQQLQSPVSVLTVKELVLTLQLLADLRVNMGELLEGDSNAQLDLSSLTEEQLDVLTKANAILKTVKR